MIKTVGKMTAELTGRGGCFVYRNSDRVAKIGVECSENPAFDILLHLDDLRQWCEPKVVALTKEEENDVYRSIIDWEQTNASKTDLPLWARRRLRRLTRGIDLTALAGVVLTAMMLCYRGWFADLCVGGIWIFSSYGLLFLLARTKQLRDVPMTRQTILVTAIVVVAGSLPPGIAATFFSDSPKDAAV